VTTGDPSENEQMRCLNLGANEFLTKPVRMRQLGESLKKLFMQSNSEVQEEIFDLTVLIIDDDMFSSDIMKRYLINKYHILQASTYEEVFILSYSYP
jgi:response regulator RpfG family c-di-GMP phosphodiesterase